MTGEPSTAAHPCKLFLHLSGIEHSRIKVRHPQTNGSTENINQTLQKGFYKVAFRKKLYQSIEAIQKDMDDFMRYYNNQRTNQGKHCQNRTLMQTFLDGRSLYPQYMFENNVEENQAA
ncbi:MAG: transposase [Candidatus Nitronauta litoralis]|uniref:Transposase n=1 Tax=Candidatus Nitronauta litoralis TaxID=2705533 RepID=A0A7T0BZM9_9BACT|nr:MAG: transposase [Candidatus Nitronauta litoralis]